MQAMETPSCIAVVRCPKPGFSQSGPQPEEWWKLWPFSVEFRKPQESSGPESRDRSLLVGLGLSGPEGSSPQQGHADARQGDSTEAGNQKFVLGPDLEDSKLKRPP